MTQPLLFLHVQDPELTSQLLQSDSVRRFVICKSQPDECWAEQLLRQPCDLAFIEIDNTEPGQYELLQQSNMLAEMGIQQSPANLRSKLSKGVFSASLLLQIFHVIAADINPNELGVILRGCEKCH